LALRAPVPTDRQASYEVRIVDANGRVVRELGGLHPSAPDEIRLNIGRLPAGTFDVSLREVAVPDVTPLELRYRFTVAESSAR
jgi:hypothetical protein